MRFKYLLISFFTTFLLVARSTAQVSNLEVNGSSAGFAMISGNT